MTPQPVSCEKALPYPDGYGTIYLCEHPARKGRLCDFSDCPLRRKLEFENKIPPEKMTDNEMNSAINEKITEICEMLNKKYNVNTENLRKTLISEIIGFLQKVT